VCCEVLTSPDDLSEAASKHVQCQQTGVLLGDNMTASLRSAATMDQLQRNSKPRRLDHRHMTRVFSESAQQSQVCLRQIQVDHTLRWASLNKRPHYTRQQVLAVRQTKVTSIVCMS